MKSPLRTVAAALAVVLLAACNPAPSAIVQERVVRQFNPRERTSTEKVVPLAAPDPADPAGDDPTPDPTDPAADDSPTGVKPGMSGLVDRKGRPPADLESVVDGFVVDVDWAALQPTAGGPITRPNPIDGALTAARSATTPLQVKLRIYAGTGAPEWAKRLGGSPIRVSHDGRTGTIPRFWDPAFGAAYEELHHRLAAIYDDAPEILEVTVARCMTFYAEPLVRHRNDRAIVAALLDGGYTAGADRTCQLEQFDAHQAWARTRSGIALNPYQVLHPDGRSDVDLAFTQEVMARCRSTLGERCVLENNSIRTPAFEGTMARMYCAIAAAGGHRTFQTARNDRVGDLAATIEWAIAHGAAAVELPSQYRSMLSGGRIAELDARLEAASAGPSAPRSC